MKKLSMIFSNIRLAFTKSAFGYLVSRIPSMMFWSVISTGLLVGGQYLYFNVLPADYFFSYKSPAHVADTQLGQTPTLDYCRTSNGTYPVVIDAQIRKVEPPVYTQQYQVTSSILEGSGCVSREIASRPTVPGDYKIFYTARVTLPFGVEKVATFETNSFKVNVPNNLYSDYSLTISDNDGTQDGKASYKVGGSLEYRLTGTALVEYFGTTERHLVCGQNDYFIDSYSGRTTAGEKDSVNRTVNIPQGAAGTCSLELRIVATVGDAKTAVTQVLRSNDFVVQ